MKYRLVVCSVVVLVLPPLAAGAQATAPAVTHICLAPAAVEATPNGVDPVSAVRDAFTSFLTGPTLSVQPLTARLQSQARQEAKIAGCTFVLLPTVKHERRTGGGSLLGRMAGGAAQQGAWAVTGAVGGSVAGRVAAGAAAGAVSSAVSGYASQSRQEDELTLSYRLENADGKELLKKSEKRKAKADGEDLMTPLAQKAAEAIASAVVK